MENLKIKRVCGFNVSSIHFSMMILPYLNKELEEKKEIIILLEGNLERNIKQVLSKVTLNKEAKEKILSLDWKSTNIDKVNIEKKIKQKITKEKNLCFIIYGDEKYINKANKDLNICFTKYEKFITNKEIKIINSYSVTDFKENIREILDNHDTIFNTSGEHKIEEIFNDYHSA